MGSKVLHPDLIASFGLATLVVAVYFLAGLRRPLPSGGDVFESIRWGKFFVGLVYACMAVLFFCLAFIRR